MSGKHRITPDEAARSQSRPPLPFPVSDGRLSPVVQMETARRKHRRRTRLAAGFTASVLAMGGAAGMSFAMADETPESGSSEVVFSGSCGLLNTVAANSSPNVDELSVSEGTQIEFTNSTGSDAELMLGDSSYAIGDGVSRAFEMNQSAEIAMIPSCGGLLPSYDTATISVTQDDSPVDNDDSSSDSGSDSSDSSDSSPHELPSPTGEDNDSAGDSDSAAADEAPDQSTEDQDAPGLDRDPMDATDDEGSPVTEEDPAEDATEEDETSLPFPPTDRDESADDSITTAGDVQAVDREQLQDGASGLLALLAIVCLVGVGAAAVRTMMVQRTPAA